MSLDLNKLLLTKNECYQTGKTITPKGIMWHSTGANNPNLKRYVGPDDGRLGVNQYGNHWNQYRPDGRQVCVHAFIGKDKNGVVCVYQTLPWNYRGWHAGGTANNNYIGFEMCEDALNDKNYFNKVYDQAVQLTAYLCKMYNLNPKDKNVIICHQDGYKLGIASNHSDVYNWFNKMGKTIDDVRNDVYKIMQSSTNSNTSNTGEITVGSKVTIKAGAVYGGLSSARGKAVSNYALGLTHTVSKIQTNNGVKEALLKEINSWVAVNSLNLKGVATSPSPTLKVGSKVTIKAGATYYNGTAIPSWVMKLTWIVKQINGDRVVIDKSSDGKYSIMSPINKKYLNVK